MFTYHEHHQQNQYDLATPATPEEIRGLLVLAGEFIEALESILKGSRP